MKDAAASADSCSSAVPRRIAYQLTCAWSWDGTARLSLFAFGTAMSRR